MPDALVQFLMAVFGLVAGWGAMGNHPGYRRWAPVVGIVGQLAWAAFALSAQRRGVDVRGLWVVVGLWTFVYARGILVQWRGQQMAAIGDAFRGPVRDAAEVAGIVLGMVGVIAGGVAAFVLLAVSVWALLGAIVGAFGGSAAGAFWLLFHLIAGVA